MARIKHVFSGYSDVAHLWAHQSQDHAKKSGGNFYFNGDTIYSYGRHFPIARIIKRRGKTAVLFTYRTYSSSTSKHTREVASACSHLPKLYVYYPSLTVFSKRELEHWDALIQEQVYKLSRARKPELYAGTILHLQQQVKDYCKFWGKRAPAIYSVAPGDLAAKFKKRTEAEQRAYERLVKQGAELAEPYFEARRAGRAPEFFEAFNEDALRAWAATTAGAERVNAFEAEERAALAREGEPVAAKILKVWKRHGDAAKSKAIGKLEPRAKRAYDTFRQEHDNAAHLRFDVKKNAVVTSKDYTIPRDVALRFYHSIQQRGKALIGTKFMEFNIDGLNGSLRIGCHDIPMTEVMEMGAFLEGRAA